MIKPGVQYKIPFETVLDGKRVAADAPPELVLFRNAAATEVEVVPATTGTAGRYHAVFTPPADWSPEDELYIDGSASIGGEPWEGIIWNSFDEVNSTAIATASAEAVGNQNRIFDGVVFFASAGALTVESLAGSLGLANRLNDCLVRITEPNGNFQVRWIRSHFIDSGVRAGFNPDLDFVPVPSVGDRVEIFRSQRGAVNVVNWRGSLVSVLIDGLVQVANSAGITTLLERITGLIRTKEQDDAADEELRDSVLTPEGAADILAGILLAGPQSQTVTFAATSGGDPVSGLIVRIAGRQFVTGTNGQFAVPLDPDDYPAELIAPSGFELLDPIVVTVANQPVVVPITLTPIGYQAEEAPFSSVLLPVINGYGQGVQGVTISLEFLAFDAGATPPAVVVPPLDPLTTGVHGLTNAKLLRFGRYRANYSYNGRTKVREFVVPDSGTFQVVEPI